MLRNYFKIAIRSLRKNRIYSLINITGLAIGMACFILISTYIKNEFSYDTFHEHPERIYRAIGIHSRPGMGIVHNAVTPGPLGPALVEGFSQIEHAARIRPVFTVYLEYGESGFYESSGATADPGLFEIFSIPLKSGDTRTALQEPFSIVLSETLAEKLFDVEDPIGKVITLSNQDESDDYTVTGIMAEYPDNSHLSFSMLTSLVTQENRLPWLRNWNSNGLATYVRLQEGAAAEALEGQFPGFLKQKASSPEATRGWGITSELYLQPLDKIHLKSGHLLYQTYNRNMGSINNIYMFSVVAVLVLLIACINFMNLSTARSLKRAKEVGIRKVIGSKRIQLILQFIGESMVITFLALVVALLLVQLVYPQFKSLFSDRIIVDFNDTWLFWAELVTIALLVGAAAGSYPAFFLSSYKPSQTLKGNFSVQEKGSRLRRGLVLLQFAIAIALLTCTGLVQDQMSYIRNKDLGMQKEQVVYIQIRDQKTRDKLPLLKSELKSNPNILRVSASVGQRGASGTNGIMNVAGTQGEQQLMMRRSVVDFDFIETMGMKLKEGRDFSRSFASDTLTSVIINETAVKELGWENPIGREFEGFGDSPNFKVIGVVRDFHFFSLHSRIEPLIMWVVPERVTTLLLKIAPENMQQTLAFVESTWRKHTPGKPFEYGFLDDYFARLYKADQNTGRLFASFSAVAIFIACLGLFALAAFSAEQRTKEIGVRKVLGASVSNIVLMLSGEFTKLILLAFFIAVPVAYYAIDAWLQNFAYRVSISFLTFMIAGLATMLIALLTVSYHAFRAASVNPAKALRYE